MKTRRVLVFGVFDLMHPGHLYLLYHARREGRELVAVAARDAAVRAMKGRSPAWNEGKRLRALRATGLVAIAARGDAEQGSYGVLKRYRPDLICLGYDQRALKKDLVRAMKEGRAPAARVKVLGAYRPRRFHTSKLRKT